MRQKRGDEEGEREGEREEGRDRREGMRKERGSKGEPEEERG